MNGNQATLQHHMKFNAQVFHNFDLSVVMPFYKRLKVFKKVLKRNYTYLQRNGIEVIIALDNPDEEEGLLSLLKQYPFINWRLIVNRQKHNVRNPAKVLNVGIRHATKKYILVSDPEVEFHTDVILQLREFLNEYPGHYATGTVAFLEEGDKPTLKEIEKLWFMPYGSIMVEKSHLEAIKGYDESFDKWGGEDDNIRKRLDMMGVLQLHTPNAKSFHREKNLKLEERLNRTRSFPYRAIKKMFYPNKIVVNDRDWGMDFNTISYDYQKNEYSKELCERYLEGFLEYEVPYNNVFKKDYQKIILCQAYNESKFLPGFLENMAIYFDGIILLDDESTDGTYDLVEHPKLLLKLKKKRNGFNDLENRNILLDVASFFRSEWFCFMDIDERFGPKTDFSFLNKSFNVILFDFIHLYDEQHYITELPYSDSGIFKRKRMFRGMGRVQINTQYRKLHFALAPMHENIYLSKVLVMHLGTISKIKRKQKYDFYQMEDKEKTYDYSYLVKPNNVAPIANIIL